jgi:hypothetical protein
MLRQWVVAMTKGEAYPKGRKEQTAQHKEGTTYTARKAVHGADEEG